MWVVGVIALGLLLLGWAVGGVAYGACYENVDPGTSRAAMCDTVGSRPGRLALPLVPPLVFVAGASVARHRAAVAVAAAALFLVDAAVLVTVLAAS